MIMGHFGRYLFRTTHDHETPAQGVQLDVALTPETPHASAEKKEFVITKDLEPQGRAKPNLSRS